MRGRDSPPFAGGESLQYGTDLPTGNPSWSPQDLSDSGQALQYNPSDSRVREVSFHLGGGGPGSTGGSPDIPPLGQPGPQSAAGLGNSISQNPVNLQDAGSPDSARYAVNGAPERAATSPSLEDIARLPPFNMTDQDFAALRKYVDQQQNVQSLIRDTMAALLPEAEVPELASGMIDLYNNLYALQNTQRSADAYQRALFNRMNNMMMQPAFGQSAPPGARGFLGN